MEKIPYNDPVFGVVELTHIKTLEFKTADTTKKQKICEFPSGDFIVLTETSNPNLPNSTYYNEHFISKEWIDVINNKNILKDNGTFLDKY